MSYPPASGPRSTQDPYSSPSGSSAQQAGYGGYGGYQAPYVGAQQHGQFANQPPAAQGAFPISHSAPAPAVKSRKAPAVLLISGLVISVVAAVILGLGITSLLAFTDSLDEISSNGSTDALEAGTDYGIYIDSVSWSTCTATGPDGADVPVQRPTATVTVNDHELVGTFTPSTDGAHTISCSSFGAPSPVFIGPPAGFGTVVKTVSGMLGGIFGLICGLPLALAGLVWFIVRTSSNKKLTRAQMSTQYPAGPAST